MDNKYYLGYHSHSTRTYNTEIEKREQDYLRTIFNGIIICPNKNMRMVKINQHYLDIVAKADCIFVSEYDGFLGKGSFGECVLALNKKIPVYTIKRNEVELWIEKVTEVIQISENNLSEFGLLISKKLSPKKLPFIK
jgi:hypothetical protein